MHEEYLKEEASKAEDQQRHFPMFGSPNKSSAGSSFSSPKGKNFKVSPTKGDKLKSPDKTATSKAYSDSENVEKVDKNERRESFSKKIKEETGQDRATNGALKDGNSANTGEDCRYSETGAEKSDNQIPCSSKDLEPLPGEATGNGHIHNQQTGEKVVSQNGANEKGGVDSENVAQNETNKNGTVEGSDSEDEVRQEDITVEERRARLKRTLSPSYYSEDVFRLKKQRVKDDSFMCK